MFYDIPYYLHTVYFLCQNPIFSNNKSLARIRIRFGWASWIRIRMEVKTWIRILTNADQKHCLKKVMIFGEVGNVLLKTVKASLFIFANWNRYLALNSVLPYILRLPFVKKCTCTEMRNRETVLEIIDIEQFEW